jgi:hypothetical protein
MTTKPFFPKTRWHQIFATILKEWLTPVGITVQTEIPVSSEPPKADIVLLTKTAKKTNAQYMRLSDGLRDSKATHLLLEFKFTESFNLTAVHQTLAYQFFYQSGQNLKHHELDCFILSSKTPRKKTLQETGYYTTDIKGIYKSNLPLFSEITLLSLNDLSDEPQNIPLKLFASHRHQMQNAYQAIQENKLPEMTKKLGWLFRGFWAIILGRGKKKMETDMDELTAEMLEEEGREWGSFWMANLSAEEKLKNVSVEEKLKDVSAKDLIEKLITDDNISDLPLEIINALKNKIKDLS